MQVKIRRIRYEDLDSIFKIIREVFPEDSILICRYISEIYSKICKYSLVACIDNNVVGFSISNLEYGRGHILYLAVDKKFQGCGIGSKLLCYTLLMFFNEYNVDEVFLEVQVNNHIAISLYSKYGFKIIRRIPRYYIDGSDCYVMSIDKNYFKNCIYDKCVEKISQL